MGWRKGERPMGTEAILNLKPDTNQRHPAHQAVCAHVAGRYYPYLKEAFLRLEIVCQSAIGNWA